RREKGGTSRHLRDLRSPGRLGHGHNLPGSWTSRPFPFPGASFSTPRTTHPEPRTDPRERSALEKRRGELGEEAHREADDVGDAALQAFDQGRAQGLDRVAAGAAFPLAEVDITLLLGVGDVLEDDRGAFEAAALLPVLGEDDEAAHHGVAAARHAVEV